jgi:hypothetical protein
MVAPQRANQRRRQGIERQLQGVTMNTHSSQRRSTRMSLVALGLGMAGLVSAAHAIAGCSGYTAPPLAPTFREAPISAGFQNAVFRPGQGRMIRVADDSDGFQTSVYRPGQGRMIRVSDDHGTADGGIVGTWRFKVISDGTAYPAPIPPDATVDFGTQQWHSDGTEIMISGGRPPSSGDVCMGTWQKTGPRTYKLKHIALAYVSSDTPPPVGPVAPAVFVGPAIIRETVVLSSSGNSFTGNFTLDQYAADEVTLLEHIAGTVTGTRFTVD